jgi:hypothetical protein
MLLVILRASSMGEHVGYVGLGCGLTSIQVRE